MGGMIPLGYDLQNRQLIRNAAEADLVGQLFRRYLELRSVHELRTELDAAGIRSKAWTSRAGRAMGGAGFSRGTLFHLLQNRLYLGEIVHGDQSFPGQHSAIVDLEVFVAVQSQLAANRVSRRERPSAPQRRRSPGFCSTPRDWP
jgi:hypothetical protein